mgnify:FL=1
MLYSVDLPETDVGRSVVVIVHCVGIASAFVGDDAFAACLVPGVFGTPLADVNEVSCPAAIAGGTLS